MLQSACSRGQLGWGSLPYAWFPSSSWMHSPCYNGLLDCHAIPVQVIVAGLLQLVFFGAQQLGWGSLPSCLGCWCSGAGLACWQFLCKVHCRLGSASWSCRFYLVVCFVWSVVCCWGSPGSYGWLLDMTLNPLVGVVAAICRFMLGGAVLCAGSPVVVWVGLQ